MMKAVMLERYGEGVDVLRMGEAPTPEPGPQDVLVEVHAAGFNPFDCKLRKGWLQRFYPFAFPHVLGVDLAGIVRGKGPAVWNFDIGDVVYGMQDTMRSGSYAEYTAVNAANLRRAPQGLSFAQAASIPMVYQTAWMGVVDQCLTRSGELVLVHGAAGGVGSAAVQLAKALGARVAATCSTGSVQFVRQLGADIVINRDSTDFRELLQNVDVVFDPIGGETNLRSYQTMRKGGRMAVVLREDPLEMANSPRLTAAHCVTRHVVAFDQRADVLDYIRPLFEQGVLKPVVTKEVPLGDVGQVHLASDAGHARGKTVLNVR